MRSAFFAELCSIYEDNPRVVFLTGDLGYKLFDPLKSIDPARVVNFGIREASMIGFASGLAAGGMLPFVYSIVPFITLRCTEQIKLDLCYNGSTVVVVGVGAGFSYGSNGPTHHGIEDVGLLSAFPGMTVWTPADPFEVRLCVRSTPDLEGPAYLRLGRNGERDLHSSQDPDHSISEPWLVSSGGDGTLVANGYILDEVLKAAEILAGDSIYPNILQLTTIKPFPGEYLCSLLADGQPVMSVEEHVVSGGLGQRIAAVVARLAGGNPFEILAVPDQFCNRCLERDAALRWAGLDAASIAGRFKQLIAGK